MWGKIDRIALAVFLCVAAAWGIKNGASTEPPSLAEVDAEAPREPAKQLAMTEERGTARKGDLLGKSPVQTGYASPDAPVDPYAGFEAGVVPKNITMLAKTAPEATGGNSWNERSIVMKKGETLGAILRDLGATPEEIKAIATVLGPRGRDGDLKEGQEIRTLLSPVRGSRRLQPVRVTLVGETAIEAVVALSDLGKYVAVDVPSAETQVAEASPTTPEAEKVLQATKPHEPAKHYDAETAMAEAREATAHMVTPWKELRGMIHFCRIGEMIGAGYNDAQIAAEPRVNALLAASDKCSEQWARTFKDGLAALAKQAAAAADPRQPVERYTLNTALQEAEAAIANEPPGMLKSVHLMIRVCRISEMLNAGYTSEQIAAQQRIAAGLRSSARCSEQWAAQFGDDLPTLQLIFTLKQVPRNTRDVILFCHFAEMKAAGYEEPEAMLRSLAASPTARCSERVAGDVLRHIDGMGPLPPEWPIPPDPAQRSQEVKQTPVREPSASPGQVKKNQTGFDWMESAPAFCRSKPYSSLTSKQMTTCDEAAFRYLSQNWQTITAANGQAYEIALDTVRRNLPNNVVAGALRAATVVVYISEGETFNPANVVHFYFDCHDHVQTFQRHWSQVSYAPPLSVAAKIASIACVDARSAN
jgi:hypothetical protein